MSRQETRWSGIGIEKQKEKLFMLLNFMFDMKIITQERMHATVDKHVC